MDIVVGLDIIKGHSQMNPELCLGFTSVESQIKTLGIGEALSRGSGLKFQRGLCRST
jgi:hypothetical protein